VAKCVYVLVKTCPGRLGVAGQGIFAIWTRCSVFARLAAPHRPKAAKTNPEPRCAEGGAILAAQAGRRAVSYGTRSQELLCSAEPPASSQQASLPRWDPLLL
jgi:hypothetical protein